MEEAGKTLTPLMENINVFICGRDDPQGIFGISLQESTDSAGADRDQRMAELLRRTVQSRCVAMTFREGISASVNGWSAMLCRDGRA